MHKYLPLLSLIFLLSCGSDDSIEQHASIVRVQSTQNLELLLKQARSVKVEVMYEAGAEPYVKKNFRNQPYWAILEANLKAIYDLRKIDVSLDIPKELAQMKLLEVQGRDSWSAEDVSDLVALNQTSSSSDTKAVVHVLFVKGHYKDEAGVKKNVIGINLKGTMTIAIFKDVVEEMGRTVDDRIARFSEQSTLVHEVGHALGLVNNGVPQINEHHDSEHGSHCTNQNCVMFWQNEGASKLANFISTYLDSGEEVMFGANCLNDLKSY